MEVNVNATLKWALPVRIEKLGAHVDAAIETLPTVTALRLCQRFGSGPQCFINKLPVELLESIEKFIVEPARESALQEWERSKRCWELKCDILDDHFTWEEQHDLYHKGRDYLGHDQRERQECPDDDCAFCHDTDDERAAETRADLLEEVDDDMWITQHDRNADHWGYTAASENPLCIFNKHQVLLKNWLGIEIWTSHARLPPTNLPHWTHEVPNTTVAYLTLPGDDEASQQNKTSYKWRTEPMNWINGYAMSLNVGIAPTQMSFRRFPRALKLLDLNVEFVSPTQCANAASSQIDAAHSDVEPSDSQTSNVEFAYAFDAEDESPSSWPRLTVLTRCEIENRDPW